MPYSALMHKNKAQSDLTENGQGTSTANITATKVILRVLEISLKNIAFKMHKGNIHH